MANPEKVIKNLLKAEEDIAEFILNGPGTGFSGHVRDRFRHRCDEFANLPPWAIALSGIAGGSISRFCTPYWDDNGNDGPVAGPPPYTGGQCPGAFYRGFGVVFQNNVQQEAASSTPSDRILGPLTFNGAVIAGGNISYPVTGADGAVSRLTMGGAEFRPASDGWEVRDVNFVFQVGVNCDTPDLPPGLQPGPNPPADPGPLPGPEPTDNPDPDNPIPFIPIPPFEDPVFGPQPITGPNADSPVAPEPPPPAGGDGLPGDPDAIGDEAGEVTGGEDGEDIDFGEPPEGRIWIGCIVETSSSSGVGNIPGTGPQSTVWPTVRANAALIYGSLRGTNNRINSRYHDLIRPVTSLIVTGCFLQVRLSSTAKVFPISALKCPENTCGDD